MTGSPVCQDTVKEIASALSGIDWYLAGGLAIPFALGQFYRRHSDIDILIHSADLTAVARALRTSGYRLYLNLVVTHRGHGVRFQIDVGSGNAIKQSARASLCFQKVVGKNPVNSMRIDVYRYHSKSGQMVTWHHRRSIPLDGPLRGHLAMENHGPINCLNLSYVDLLKSNRSGPKHHLDRFVIKEGVAESERWLRTHPELVSQDSNSESLEPQPLML